MTASATRHARTKVARLAILRELHTTGYIIKTDDRSRDQFIADMCNDGVMALVDGYLVVTKAGLRELTEAQKCFGTS